MAIAAFIWAFVTLGMSTYVNRVPTAESVRGVIIGHFVGFGFVFAGERFIVEDAAIISQTIGVHNEILSSRHELQSLQSSRFAGFSEANNNSLIITYILQNGNQIIRHYRFGDNFAAESGVDDLANAPPILFANRWSQVSEPSEIEVLLFSIDDFMDFGDFRRRETVQMFSITDSSHIEQIFDIVKQDWLLTNAQERQNQLDRMAEIPVESPQRVINISAGLSNSQMVDFPLLHFELSAATLQWLREFGYLGESVSLN